MNTGVAWNDPELAVEWMQDAPQLSERDRDNPLLADLPVDRLPRLGSA